MFELVNIKLPEWCQGQTVRHQWGTIRRSRLQHRVNISTSWPWGVGVPNKDTDLRVTRRGLSLENDGHVCLCPVYHFMWFLHEIHEIKSTAIVRRCWDQEILFWTFIERNLRAEPRTKTQHKQGAYTKNADILIRIIYIILKIVDFQHTNLQLHHSIS